MLGSGPGWSGWTHLCKNQGQKARKMAVCWETVGIRLIA